MKKLYTTASIAAFFMFQFAASPNVSAQGWIGNGGNILYARNSALNLTPIYVGIGTSSPTAQLHTTGSVRFAGLTNSNQSRIIVSDASGNLYYRDASTLGSGWLLSGNSAVATDFIGTTNSQDFRIRTDNVQRMVVSSSGNVGIHDAAPNYKLSIVGNDAAGGTYDGRTYINLFNQSTTTTSSVAIRLGAGNSAYYGGISYASTTYNLKNDSDYVNTMNLYTNGHGIQLTSISDNGSLRLATRLDANNLPIVRMIVAGNGDVGIGIGSSQPTATLHTNGTVRFQSLPSGTGTALVIDANGNIYRSNASLRQAKDSTSMTSLENEVLELKKEVAALQTSVEMLKLSGNSINTSDGAVLYQNAPNPFSLTTDIRYYIPQQVASAVCIIYDIQGKEKKRIDIGGRGNGNINVGNLNAGTYVYSLYTNGKLADAKKMTVVR